MINQPTQVLVTAYPDVCKTAALLAPTTKQLAINMVRAFNRSGGAANVGILKKFSSASFGLYTFDGTSTYTAAAVPSTGTPGSILLASPATAGNGFVIQSKYKSGLIGFTVSQTGSGGTYVYEYWNGSAWVTLNTVAVPVFTSAADIVILFLPPVDWVVGGSSGLSASLYSIRVRATTRPATDVKVSALWSGALLEFYDSVADKSSVELEFDTQHPFVLEAAEGIMAYFGTANAGNGLTISYSTF